MYDVIKIALHGRKERWGKDLTFDERGKDQIGLKQLFF